MSLNLDLNVTKPGFHIGSMSNKPGSRSPTCHMRLQGEMTL